MAFTTEQLTALEAAYAAGELTVKDGDRLVTYGSEAELKAKINTIRRQLQSRSSRYTVGISRFRSPR